MIGVCGGIWGDGGVGKTTVTNIIAKKFGFYPVSFIEPVRDMARKLFNWEGEMDSEARLLFDRICRTGRSVSENYWRDLTVSRIPNTCDKIIFDDVWFPNEVSFITANGGKIIRVLKNGHEFVALPCEALEIQNDGSLADLQMNTILSVTNFL